MNNLSHSLVSPIDRSNDFSFYVTPLLLLRFVTPTSVALREGILVLSEKRRQAKNSSE